MSKMRIYKMYGVWWAEQDGWLASNYNFRALLDRLRQFNRPRY